MLIYVVKVKIRMGWVHSLKEKRMVVKSICAKLKNKFNVSVAEVEEQDVHQTAVIAYTYIACNRAQGDSIYENTMNYLEENTDGEIIHVDHQIY